MFIKAIYIFKEKAVGAKLGQKTFFKNKFAKKDLYLII